MPELVPMPKLGFDMAEGTLVRKVKQDGESVNKGEVLAEIETDKATVEVEAPASGVLKGWVVEEGQPVPVGALMAVIGAADEQVDLAALKGGAGDAASGAATKAAVEEVPQGGAMGKVEPPTPAQTSQAPVERQAPPGNGQAPAGGPEAPASPIARKMASEAGVDLRQIKGTGPGGRITKKDVEQYLSQPRPEPAATRATPAAVPVAAREDQEVPLTRMRAIIARRMTESKQTVPQFYVNTEIDMGAAMDLRKQLNALVPKSASSRSTT
jgi:pyruvate dehydrogenase E2 component (dihydrolipoamide acetyltransferase)